MTPGKACKLGRLSTAPHLKSWSKMHEREEMISTSNGLAAQEMRAIPLGPGAHHHALHVSPASMSHAACLLSNVFPEYLLAPFMHARHNQLAYVHEL